MRSFRPWCRDRTGDQIPQKSVEKGSPGPREKPSENQLEGVKERGIWSGSGYVLDDQEKRKEHSLRPH